MQRSGEKADASTKIAGPTGTSGASSSGTPVVSGRRSGTRAPRNPEAKQPPVRTTKACCCTAVVIVTPPRGALKTLTFLTARREEHSSRIGETIGETIASIITGAAAVGSVPVPVPVSVSVLGLGRGSESGPRLAEA